MSDNLIVVAAAVVLISAVFISVLDARNEQSPSDLLEQSSSDLLEQSPSDLLEQNSLCNLPCNNLNNILVSVGKNGSTSQYNMFVDIVSKQIFAVNNFNGTTTDVQGKRPYSYKYIC